jgi:hypothetical protein
MDKNKFSIEIAGEDVAMYKGEPGEKGEKGDKGDNGNKGDKGEQGGQGIKGIDGTNGLNGKDGKDGKDGKNGVNGIDGRDGKDGKDGERGEKGKDGKSLSQEDIDRIGKKLKDNESNLLWVNNGAVKEIRAGSGVTITGDPQTPTISVSGGSGTGIVDTIIAGTGISVNSTDPANPIVTNSSPDQTVSITAGTNITSVTGTYPNFTINAATQSGGSGITRTITSIASPTTAGATAAVDYVYLVSGTTTLTLPTAVSNLNQYIVKNISGATTVATTSAQTINGSSTVTILVGSVLTFISDNANWHVV